MQQYLQSWAGRATTRAVETVVLHSTDDNPFPGTHARLLARGYGCSYGDVCLPVDAAVLCTELRRIRSFDTETGIICAEAGLQLGDLVALTIPHGWTLPVLPGIGSVSIGGAIANDIHGKSHHWAGTFGRWVRRFELLRSDGRVECSPSVNTDLFCATIGGLGLTGIITWAELELVRCPSPWMECRHIPFRSLEEYAACVEQSEKEYEYVVAWCDLSNRGKVTGIIHAARFCEQPANRQMPRSKRAAIEHLPRLPFGVFTRPTVWLGNRLRHLVHRMRAESIEYYHTVLFPFNGIPWNHLFGRRGFFQLHAVLPAPGYIDAATALLKVLWESNVPLPLCVLKNFSSLQSPGILSFPMPGMSIAIDIPNTSRSHEALQTIIAEIVERGGRIYPAKDALMGPEQFQRMYPLWHQVERLRDPRCCSEFWQRVTKLTSQNER